MSLDRTHRSRAKFKASVGFSPNLISAEREALENLVWSAAEQSEDTDKVIGSVERYPRIEKSGVPGLDTEVTQRVQSSLRQSRPDGSVRAKNDPGSSPQMRAIARTVRDVAQARF